MTAMVEQINLMVDRVEERNTQDIRFHVGPGICNIRSVSS
jgi:hypothetical protein